MLTIAVIIRFTYFSQRTTVRFPTAMIMSICTFSGRYAPAHSTSFTRRIPYKKYLYNGRTYKLHIRSYLIKGVKICPYSCPPKELGLTSFMSLGAVTRFHRIGQAVNRKWWPAGKSSLLARNQTIYLKLLNAPKLCLSLVASFPLKPCWHFGRIRLHLARLIFIK